MFERISRKENYIGPLFGAYTDTIRTSDGRAVRRDIIEKHSNAAAVLAVKDGKVLFVRQYRHSVGAQVLEIPAGTLDEGEAPIACARRELEEETGCRAESLSFMFHFYTTVGFCNEQIHIYYADALSQGRQHLDDDEELTIEAYTLDEALGMVFDGRIVDAKTIAALLGYQVMRSSTSYHQNTEPDNTGAHCS